MQKQLTFLLSFFLMVNIWGQKKNNILFIAVDDLKPLLSNYGHSEMKTPNFDRLAKMGVTFTNAHVQQAVCGPSRASIMTGTYPDVTRVRDLETDFRESNPNLISMPEYLISQGYETAGIGKIYHKGSSAPGHDGKSWTIPHLLPDGNDPKLGEPNMGYQDPKTKAAFESIIAELEKGGKVKANMRDKALAKLKPSTECVDISDEGYQDGVYTVEALKLMKSMASGSKPFFLAVGYQRPHLPFVAPKKYWDLYKRENIKIDPLQTLGKDIPKIAYHNFGELRSYTDIPQTMDFGQTIDVEKQKELVHGYMACVSYIDAQLGKLLDAYFAMGLDKNTEIVLWGDHGFHLGDHTIWCKHSNFEQATHIPLMFAGPGIQKNIKVNQAVELLDVFPTLFDLANVPKSSQAQGKSLLPLMDDDKKTTVAKDFAISQYSRLQTIIGYSIRTDKYRYTEWHDNNYNSMLPYNNANITAYELYDYEKDALESQNLNDKSEYAAIKTALKSKLKTHLDNQFTTVKASKFAPPEGDVPSSGGKGKGKKEKKEKQNKGGNKKGNKNKSEDNIDGHGKSEADSDDKVEDKLPGDKSMVDPKNEIPSKSKALPKEQSPNATPEKKYPDNNTSQLPNVLFIHADDFGFHDLSINGSKIYETPNIDRLSKQGITFQNAYSSYPRCTPSRYGLITGTYPVNEDHGNVSSIPAESNFIKQFDAAGYQTSYIGKWHLGGEQNAPKGFGFDHSFAAGTAGATGTHFYPFNNKKSKTDEEKNIEDVTAAGKEGDYLADLLTNQTIDFIKKADKNKPFFAMLAQYAVHQPLEAKKEDEDRNAKQIAAFNFGTTPEYIQEGEGRRKMRQDNATYAGMVENLDYNVGRLLDALKEMGLDKNTIIVFSSDHGGLSNDGNKASRNLATTNFPLRAGKGHLYEGGVRVPLIMTWANHIKPTVNKESIVLGMDVMPTLLDLAINKELKNIDGKSFESVINGQDKWDQRTVFWHEQKARPYSTGDIPCTSMRSGNYKLMHFFEKGIYELYDLSKDISEENNLIDKLPDVAKKMKAEMDAWRLKYKVDVSKKMKKSDDASGEDAETPAKDTSKEDKKAAKKAARKEEKKQSKKNKE